VAQAIVAVLAQAIVVWGFLMFVSVVAQAIKEYTSTYLNFYQVSGALVCLKNKK
jgi:hypothetical protein